MQELQIGGTSRAPIRRHAPGHREKNMAAIDLIADIGATNARISFRGGGALSPLLHRKTADFASLGDLLRDAVAEAGVQVRRIALAVAGPVLGDEVRLTNLPWTFSAAALARELKAESIVVDNDLAAMARAVPHLSPTDHEVVHRGAKIKGPMAVIGPGTGLGLSLLVPRGSDFVVVASEGGHALAAPTPALEPAVRAAIWDSDCPSWEDLVSGRGLHRLYLALGGKDASIAPEDVTARARAGDPAAQAAVHAFAILLGAFAGDVVLIGGARGGCYLTGGLLPAMGALFESHRFAAGYAAKGDYRRYTLETPVFRVTHEEPALLGLQILLDQRAP
jgi:glucokinase